MLTPWLALTGGLVSRPMHRSQREFRELKNSVQARLYTSLMASWLITRQLRKVSTRLTSLREELRVIDEQAMYLGDDAADAELRAIVSESGRDAYHAREAGGHAAAMASHRAKVVAEIGRLERRQDELLDQMNG